MHFRIQFQFSIFNRIFKGCVSDSIKSCAPKQLCAQITKTNKFPGRMKKIMCIAIAIPSAEAKAPFQKRVRKIIAKQSESFAPASFSNSLIKSDNFSRFFFSNSDSKAFFTRLLNAALNSAQVNLWFWPNFWTIFAFSQNWKKASNGRFFPIQFWVPLCFWTRFFVNFKFSNFQIFKFSNFLFFQIFRNR